MKKAFIVCTTILIVTACQKERLPKATQNGSNTFGCLVGNKLWIPNGVHELFVSMPAITGGYWVEYGTNKIHIEISTIKDYGIGGNEEYVDLRVNGDATGTYILNGRKDSGYLYPSYGSFTISYGGNMKTYGTDSLHTGTVIITRADRHVLSGTFQFIGYNDAKKESVIVANGRFDIAL